MLDSEGPGLRGRAGLDRLCLRNKLARPGTCCSGTVVIRVQLVTNAEECGGSPE